MGDIGYVGVSVPEQQTKAYGEILWVRRTNSLPRPREVLEGGVPVTATNEHLQNKLRKRKRSETKPVPAANQTISILDQ